MPNAKQSPDCKLSVESVTVKNETLSEGPMEALQAAYSIKQASNGTLTLALRSDDKALDNSVAVITLAA